MTESFTGGMVSCARSPRGRKRLVEMLARSALGTRAEDRQVAVVRVEPVLPDQSTQGALHLGASHAGHPATLPADEVGVLVATRGVVRRRPVAEVGVPDQAELVEQLEGAIDRGEVDRL